MTLMLFAYDHRAPLHFASSTPCVCPIAVRICSMAVTTREVHLKNFRSEPNSCSTKDSSILVGDVFGLRRSSSAQ
jgi:hypothetical protein